MSLTARLRPRPRREDAGRQQAARPAVPTFVLGVGCQKGGTTWIYKYLKGSGRFVHGFRKEYHVFDALDVPEVAVRREQILDRAQEAVDAQRAGEPVRADWFQWAAMLSDPRFYFDYFAGLVHRPGKGLAADVTPDYALLSAQRLTEIREEFARRGVRTVAVFTMRDPVDRTLSAIRMTKRIRPEHVPDDVPDAVRRRYAEEAYAARSDYAPTLRALAEAFPAEDVYVGLYEELFDQQSSDREVRRLCDVVGVEFRPPDYGFRPNETAGEPDPLPPDVARTVAHHHAESYRAAADRLGLDLARLGQVWPGARHLL